MFDLSSPHFHAERYGVYSYLLREEPVFWYEPMHSWLVCRFDDIQQVIRAGAVTTDFLIADKVRNSGDALGGATRAVLDVVRTWMIYNDAETHARLRRFMNQAFARTHIDRVLPGIKAIIQARLHAAVGHRRAGAVLDLVETFAHPVPAQILRDMLGLDEIPLTDFLRWSDSIALFMQDFVVSPVPNNMIAIQTARDLESMAAAFRQSIASRRRLARNDLLSSLVSGLDRPPAMITEGELCYQLIHLIFGGHKIPQFVIANTLHLLFQHSDVMQQIRDGAISLRDVVQESMRFEGPIQFITRHALQDFDLGGKTIRKVDSIFLMLGAANRDPAAFDEPNRFAPGLKRRPSLAFGSGPHVCIGATLVISELEEILAALLRSQQEIQPLYNLAAPEWSDNATFHGINTMPVRLAEAPVFMARHAV